MVWPSAKSPKPASPPRSACFAWPITERRWGLTDTQLADGEGFTILNTQTDVLNASIASSVKYDLLGKIAENVHLTRKTLSDILGGIEKVVFDQFKLNPEYFIAEASRLINEQKATIIIEKLVYDEVAGM